VVWRYDIATGDEGTCSGYNVLLRGLAQHDDDRISTPGDAE
jgi:hypothetical protein